MSSTPLELRVADCLSLIKDHVMKRGLDHPEGLVVTLPLLERGLIVSEVTVSVHVNVDERDDILQQAAEQALGNERRHHEVRRRGVAQMEAQLQREHAALMSGNADD